MLLWLICFFFTAVGSCLQPSPSRAAASASGVFVPCRVTQNLIKSILEAKKKLSQMDRRANIGVFLRFLSLWYIRDEAYLKRCSVANSLA